MNNTTAQRIIEKTRDDYDRIADHFAQTRQEQWPAVVQSLQQYCHEGDKVLDVGCGNGRVANAVDKIKAHYTGMDISPKLIALATKQHPHATFVVGTMTQMPFPSAHFDVLLLVASFHHLPSHALRQQTLHECARVLKPRGIVIMLHWNLWQPRFWWKHLRHASNLNIPWKDAFGNIRAKRFYHSITKREMRKLAGQTFFSMVEQYYERDGQKTSWRKGKNLVSILQKKFDNTQPSA